MVAFYLLARLVIVLVFYVLRLIPVVGRWISSLYDEQMFDTLLDDVAIDDATVERDDDGPRVVVLTFSNDNWLDLTVTGISLRVADDADVTQEHVVWPPEFEHPPGHVSSETITGEGDGRLTLRLPAADTDAAAELVDGSILFKPSLAWRGRRFSVGRREFTVETELNDRS
ncbi:hypothetical protein [Haloarchaeobius sp. TZWWS8]|uniref:hypothetical protein n=1 Tax=Haloarchaeobius sp. TZWWS8 TaxID=3446121 RepID=UPI003EBC0311